MKVHRGNILRKAIEKSGFSLLRISKETRISRNTLYKLLDSPDADLGYILKIAMAIKYDFSSEIPDLSTPLTPEIQENLDYKFKYYELAEKYMRALEEKEKLLKDLNKKQ